MTTKFCISVAAIFFNLQMPANAQYMSMFNSASMAGVNFAGTVAVNSAIGNSAKIASKKTKTEGWLAPADRTQKYQPIPYANDKSVRVAVVKTYMDRARKIDAKEGEALEHIFASRDLFGETRGNLRAYGLDMNDLGDVITAYWAVNWGAVTKTGRPSREQVKGLQGQIRKTLAGSEINRRTSASGRQQIADDMLMRLILIDGAVQQGLREGNTKQLDAVSQHVRQSSFVQMGIDLGKLKLTSKGFVSF